MKKQIISTVLFSFFLTLFSNDLNAQECGTSHIPMPEEIKTNALKFFQPEQTVGARTTFDLPLQIHIIRTNNGTGGLSNSKLEDGLERLNESFEGSGISFFICGNINYINDSGSYSFEKSDYPSFADQHNKDNVINIYFANKVKDNGDNLAGFATLPWATTHMIMMGNDYADKSTLVHEMGHFLGLYHTHETSNGKEYVNGSNCQNSGDYFCDTPADPKLSYSTINTNCRYTGNEKDPNGQYYTPDPTNYMSYSRKECRTNFTSSQISAMKYFIENSYGHLICESTPNDTEFTLLAPITVSPSVIICDEPFVVHTDIWNTSSSTFYGDYTAALFDDKQEFVDHIEILSEVDGLPANYHYTNGLTFEYSGGYLQPGKYEIGIFAFAAGGEEWTPALDGDFENFIDVYVSCNNTSSTQEEEQEAFSVVCFPNPAKDFVTWQLNTSNNEMVNLEVFSVGGALVYQKQTQGEKVFKTDVSGWGTGIYFYKITTDDMVKSGRLRVHR